EPSISDLTEAAADTSGSGDFTVGAWTGGPLADDPDGGCLMSRDVNHKVALMVYANGNEAFHLNFYNADWDFEADAAIDPDLLFDGTTFPLASVEVRNPQVLTLYGGGEEEGFQPMFE